MENKLVNEAMEAVPEVVEAAKEVIPEVAEKTAKLAPKVEELCVTLTKRGKIQVASIVLAAGFIAGGTVYTSEVLLSFARDKYKKYKFKKAIKSAAEEEPAEEAEPVVEEIPTVKAKKVKG